MEKTVRLGRDFTNQLSYHFCKPEEKKQADDDNKNGVWYPDILATGVQRQKVALGSQLDVIAALKMHHLELDLNPKQPYDKMLQSHPEVFAAFRTKAAEMDISVSTHLSYAYVTASVCAPQAYHRAAGLVTIKREIDIAAALGSKHVVMHGGTIPWWEDNPGNQMYLSQGLTDTLVQAGRYAEEKGIILHLENNVVVDSCFYKIEDCMDVIDAVQKQGVNVLFNFDVGHFMTCADKGMDISALETILEDERVAKYSTGIQHLNGYIPQEKDEAGNIKPGTGRYHPLLHKEESPLKVPNIKNHARLNREIGTFAVTVESAASGYKDMIDMDAQLVEETQLVLECFGYEEKIEGFKLEELITLDAIEAADKIVAPMIANGF